MRTFSPNYSTITIAVNEERSDSMRSWNELHKQTLVRPLNWAVFLPCVGGCVAAYRGITATADIISSLFKLAMTDQDWLYQGMTGVRNLARASVEIIPTLCFILLLRDAKIRNSDELIFALMISSVISSIPAGVIGGLLVGWDHFCNWFNHFPYRAPVAAYFDGVCAIKLSPGNSRIYTAEQWLDQLYRYGQWTQADFV